MGAIVQLIAGGTCLGVSQHKCNGMESEGLRNVISGGVNCV